MEKFTQYRDRGTGIAPFIPSESNFTKAYLPVGIFLFILRLPLFIIGISGLLILQWLRACPLFKKAVLWIFLGYPGLWRLDLQIDKVKRGASPSRQSHRLPESSDIIVSSFSSPMDAIYLAAVFDPIFTVSYPSTKEVRVISLLGAILLALAKPEENPPRDAVMTDIKALVTQNKSRIIAVFPECTTTNGMGILRMSPSLYSMPKGAKIFPIHIRYIPYIITTPIPGSFLKFIWNLLSQLTCCIRVRIAEALHDSVEPSAEDFSSGESTPTNIYLPTKTKAVIVNKFRMSSSSKTPTQEFFETNLLDSIGEALARLGRVRRVRLSVAEKIAFLEAWEKAV